MVYIESKTFIGQIDFAQWSRRHPVIVRFTITQISDLPSYGLREFALYDDLTPNISRIFARAVISPGVVPRSESQRWNFWI